MNYIFLITELLLITDRKKALNNKGRLITSVFASQKKTDVLYCCPTPLPKMSLPPPKQIVFFQAIDNALENHSGQ